MIDNIKAKNIILPKNISSEVLAQLNAKSFKKLNNQDQWNVNREDSEFAEQFNIVFAVSQQIKIESLTVKSKNNKFFLSGIFHPRFVSLIVLSIQQSMITSLQPIVFINSPILQEINLGGNRITSLSGLSKLNTMSLWALSLHKNNLINPQNYFKHLARFPLGGHKKVCETIKIQTKALPEQAYPILQCQDLSFFAKLSLNFVSTFQISHCSRIEQQKIRQFRKRKNSSKMNQFVFDLN